jgi:hypothetical protein
MVAGIATTRMPSTARRRMAKNAGEERRDDPGLERREQHRERGQVLRGAVEADLHLRGLRGVGGLARGVGRERLEHRDVELVAHRVGDGVHEERDARDEHRARDLRVEAQPEPDLLAGGGPQHEGLQQLRQEHGQREQRVAVGHLDHRDDAHAPHELRGHVRYRETPDAGARLEQRRERLVRDDERLREAEHEHGDVQLGIAVGVRRVPVEPEEEREHDDEARDEHAPEEVGRVRGADRHLALDVRVEAKAREDERERGRALRPGVLPEPLGAEEAGQDEPHAERDGPGRHERQAELQRVAHRGRDVAVGVRRRGAIAVGGGFGGGFGGGRRRGFFGRCGCGVVGFRGHASCSEVSPVLRGGARDRCGRSGRRRT